MKTEYKTPERIRNRSLRHYQEHRAEHLIYQEAYRRAKGIPVRPPKRSKEERLTAIVVCACGRRVTTPSLLLKGSTKCLRCVNPRKWTTAGHRESSRQYRTSKTNAFGKFREWRKEQVCMDCGRPHTQKKPLDLHHRDPVTKLFRVSRGVHRVSQKKLWAEVAKCDSLCHKCHDRRHQ